MQTEARPGAAPHAPLIRGRPRPLRPGADTSVRLESVMQGVLLGALAGFVAFILAIVVSLVLGVVLERAFHLRASEWLAEVCFVATILATYSFLILRTLRDGERGKAYGILALASVLGGVAAWVAFDRVMNPPPPALVIVALPPGPAAPPAGPR